MYYDTVINIDEERQRVNGYITDLLNDYTVDWLGNAHDKSKPVFVYLSHKAVHEELEPAKYHEDIICGFEVGYTTFDEKYRTKL